MKKRNKSKSTQLIAESDVELYVRLEIQDQVIVEEHILRNAIDLAIRILFGEIGSQSIQVEIVSFRYGTALIRTRAKMLNQVRCALAFYGIHDKRECAFRIDTKLDEDNMTKAWKHFKFDPRSVYLSCHTDEKLNDFDTLLWSEWDRAASQGVFTYQIDKKAKTRILDGGLNYIVELNTNRDEKRRAPDSFNYVNTPFDKNKFNFNKIKDDEVLLSLDNEQQTDKHLIVINNTPIRRYQVLLVPNRQLEQPQIVTIDGILFGIQFVTSSAHPYIYVGFNSLCAFASVNHFHFHGIYMPSRLFIQTLKCDPFSTKANCYLVDLFNVQGFAFEVKEIDQCETVAQYVHRITNYLVASDIAHNLAIVKGDSFSCESQPAVRIFVWFRQSHFGEKMCLPWRVGCIELSGYTFFQHEDVFNNKIESELRKQINELGLAPDKQAKIRDDVKHLLEQ